MFHRFLAIALIWLHLVPTVLAAGEEIIQDVVNSGGGQDSASNNYRLSDSIGETAVGESGSEDYRLQSGFLQQESSVTSLSSSCTGSLDLGALLPGSDQTSSLTCNVETNNPLGYQISAQSGRASNSTIVGWWPFDETSGSQTFDRSGNGHTGTHENGPGISNDVPYTFTSTRRIAFDGSDDDVNLGHAASLMTNSDRTIAAWIKLDSTASASAKTIVSQRHSVNAPDEGFVLELHTNGTLQYFRPGGTVASTTVPVGYADTWHHVAVVRSGSTNQLYWDGVPVGAPTTDASGTMASDTDLIVGSDAEGSMGHFWKGGIDDVRFYHRAFSSLEVQGLASLSSLSSLSMSGAIHPFIPAFRVPGTGSLLGHWALDEQSDVGVVADRTALQQDLVRGGTPTSSADIPASAMSSYRSMMFDGSTDLLSLADASALEPSNLTIGGWVKTTSSAGGFIVGHWASASEKGYGLRMESTGLASFDLGHSGTTTTVTSSTEINDGLWHHITGTFDGTTQKIFIDGMLEASSTASSVTYDEGSFTIGALTGPTSGFDGKIDDVRVYGVALSSESIGSLSGLPSLWSVSSTEAAYGLRLSASSTDTDAKWGSNGGSSRWIHSPEQSLVLASRNSATESGGSEEIVNIRVALGSSALLTPGRYGSTVVVTAIAY